MPEPPDNADNGPDFSFLGNDAVDDAPGELDFSVPPPVNAEPNSLRPNGEESVPSKSSSEGDSEQSPANTDKPGTSVTPQSGAEATEHVEIETKSVEVSAPKLAVDVEPVTSPPERGEPDAEDRTVSDDAESGQLRQTPMVTQKTFSIVAGYAAALTLLFLILWVTGRVSLTGAHQLESLPDIAPLQNNEFQHVPADASLPHNHTLKLGESQRFGDVIVTPLRVTTEPVTFAHMSSGKTDSSRTTAPVLKLWFELKNASDDVAFPPWDVALMCNRSPAEGTDDSTKANSWLMIRRGAAEDETRVLNFFHPPASEYDLVGQHSRQLVQPGQMITTYVASSPDFSQVAKESIEGYRWRLQLRKGINRRTENGVTTLVDVAFTTADISTSG
ncbi:MAG: hypothetical protein P8J37_22455 [Fuerstiella sp.]|nr:hypothetical protein [Fuerstiella sp.]